MFYIKRPVKIEAFQYDGDLVDGHGNWYVPEWMKTAFLEGTAFFGESEPGGPPTELFINTLEGKHHVSVGDYVIRGVEGEMYPCKPGIFEKTYAITEDSSIGHDCKVLAEHYGYDPQSRQLIEEMAELTQAINKFWRKDLRCGEDSFSSDKARGERFENIQEEIADVEILLEQIKGILGITEPELNAVKMKKMDDAIRIIQEGKKRECE